MENLVVAEPGGIPLNLSNNADSRSFPFRSQPNYMWVQVESDFGSVWLL